MAFIDEVAIDEAEARAMARGLYAVAACDGVHEREEALIASFWADVGAGAVALAELKRGAAVTGEELAAQLRSPAVRELFARTALLLAYADGVMSPAERTTLDGFAKALAIDAARMAALEGEVKEYLLSHLTHLSNSSAVAEVAKKLAV